MKAFKHVLILIAMLFFQHCTKPVDFDQIDHANVRASYITTLIHLSLSATDFLNEINEEKISLSDGIELAIKEGAEDYIEKIEFTLITENSFDRSFSLNFNFLNEFQQPIYTLNPTVIVPENSLDLTTIVEIPQEDIYIISEAGYIEATIGLLPGSDSISEQANQSSVFKLKSSMKLYVNFSGK